MSPPSTSASSNHGINPKSLVGKVLKRSKRSASHPTLTLEFADNTSFQLRVDGYDPRHKGLPKSLLINDLTSQQLPTNSPIMDCVFIQLEDKAFHRDASSGRCTEWWNQDHTAIALKFESQWHTVCARLQDHDVLGGTIFRSYADVYIEQLSRSPRKRMRTHL